MKVRSLNQFPISTVRDKRPYPPGAGFLIVGVLSLCLWAGIAAIAVLF
jgi:hypothetical protein